MTVVLGLPRKELVDLLDKVERLFGRAWRAIFERRGEALFRVNIITCISGSP